MRTFTDAANRPWSLTLTVGAIRKVKAGIGLDLTDLHAGDPPLILRLTNSLPLLFDVVAELVRSQMATAGITAEQFEAGFDGPAVDRAQAAFWGELADFFRPWRPAQTEVIEELTAMKREPISPVPSGESSTSAPASSESAPTT